MILKLKWKWCCSCSYFIKTNEYEGGKKIERIILYCTDEIRRDSFIIYQLVFLVYTYTKFIYFFYFTLLFLLFRPVVSTPRIKKTGQRKKLVLKLLLYFIRYLFIKTLFQKMHLRVRENLIKIFIKICIHTNDCYLSFAFSTFSICSNCYI